MTWVSKVTFSTCFDKPGDRFFDPKALFIVPPVVAPDFLKSFLTDFPGFPKALKIVKNG